MSPLGEDDGILLLPLQTPTLGDLSGLWGDVVLSRQRAELGFRHCCRVLVFFCFVTNSAFSHVPPTLLSSTSPLTLHSTIGQRDSSLEPGHCLPQPPVKPTEQSCSRSPAHHPENGPLTSEQLSRLLGKEPLIASRLEFTTNLALMRASQTVIQLQDSPSECTPGCEEE